MGNRNTPHPTPSLPRTSHSSIPTVSCPAILAALPTPHEPNRCPSHPPTPAPHTAPRSEMGRAWYEDQGKYLNKRNTFMDFISCAEALQVRKHTFSRDFARSDGRAGGL